MKVTTTARVLARLTTGGNMNLTTTQVATALGVTKPTAKRNLKKLHGLGFVYTYKNEDNADWREFGRGRNGKYVEDLWASNGEDPCDGITAEAAQTAINAVTNGEKVYTVMTELGFC